MATATTAAQAGTSPIPSELRDADIVMKGGITSGVVYPGAVWELAQAFRFRSIGGASAGAIAAAATAAAEHGRQSGAGEGFAGVKRLPEWLAADDGRVFGFFQPQAKTRALFEIAAAFVGARPGRPRRVARAVLRAVPGPLLLGLLPAVVLAAAASAGGWLPIWTLALVVTLIAGLGMAIAVTPAASEAAAEQKTASDPTRRSVTALAIVSFVVLTILGALAVANHHGAAGEIAMGLILVLALLFLALVIPLAVAVGALVTRAMQSLPRNFYGLCTGNGPDGKHGRPALTPWLADYLDQLAGPQTDAAGRPRPLTFGDLDRYDITLETMTTNLTAVRGHRLPFEDSGREHWWFDPVEFLQLFPASVVAWMTDHARQNAGDEPRSDGKVRLPRQADLPVVVAARMSLSFPILLSAVPLYTHKGGGSPPRVDEALTRCWFSDGGLVSNFPIHFFDSPLPRWPTFAINLRGFPNGQKPSPNARDNIYLAGSETGDSHEDWTEIGSVTAFVGSLKSVLENAHDNEQMLQVGYRDRIAHVLLADDEGGLNLKMPSGRVMELSKRGAFAGAALRERFTAPPRAELSWANHRWVRYRITMANLQQFLERFARGYDYCVADPLAAGCPPNEPSYAELINRAKGAPPETFFWAPGQQAFGKDATEALAVLATQWGRAGVRLEDPAMQPHTVLRNVPKS